MQQSKYFILIFSVSLLLQIPSVFAEDFGYDISSIFRESLLQKYPLSCELSATSNILSIATKKPVSEEEIFNQVPKSMVHEKAIATKKGKIWGNPDIGFVGSLDGIQYKYTGYGVYESPLVPIFTSYGFQTKVINTSLYTPGEWDTESHLFYLLRALEDGNFVQLWGDICTDPSMDDGEISLQSYKQVHFEKGLIGKNNCSAWGKKRDMFWYFKSNDVLQKIYGLNGEHAFILLGYQGDIHNPTYIKVFDTLTGIHTYPTGEWIRKWGLVNNRSIIIYTKNQTSAVKKISYNPQSLLLYRNISQILIERIKKEPEMKNILLSSIVIKIQEKIKKEPIDKQKIIYQEVISLIETSTKEILGE